MPSHQPQSPISPTQPPSVILVTAGYDHTIRFWEALSGVCSRTIQHPDSVCCLWVECCFVLLTTIYLFSILAFLSLLFIQFTLPSNQKQINKLLISPDKKYLFAAGNPSVRVFDLQSGNTQAVTLIDSHKVWCLSCAFMFHISLNYIIFPLCLLYIYLLTLHFYSIV